MANTCKVCGTVLSNDSAFCPNCGTGYEWVKKKSKRDFIVQLCVIGGVSVFAIVMISILVFSNRGKEIAKETTKNKQTIKQEVIIATASPALKETASPAVKIAFKNEDVEVRANVATPMTDFLELSNIDPSNLVWSCDSDAATIDNNGNLTVGGYQITTTVTALDMNHADTKATIRVVTKSENDDLIQAVNELNNEGMSTNQIAVYQTNLSVPKRNTNLTWDSKLFYSLEDISLDSEEDGKINNYLVEKKQLINQDTGNPMEYEIYTNPENEKVNKIVSIEYMKDKLEIIDYYYTNDGKVNFIYKRNDVNYVPTYAQLGKKGQRFLFCDDNLVTWRIVKSGDITNYCVGKKELKRTQAKGSINKTRNELSDDLKQKFDDTEVKMLNAAYNTFNTIMNVEGISTIRGYVYDEEGNALDSSQVQLLLEGSDEGLYQTKTDSTGMYTINVPFIERNYELSINKSGYNNVHMYKINVDEQQIGAYQEGIYLTDEKSGSIDWWLSTYDALNQNENRDGMLVISDALITIRDGVNNIDGNIVFSGTVDYEGRINAKLPAGMYTVCMEKSGYLAATINIVISFYSSSANIYATPKLDDGETRIVLTWGEYPEDLDSHLFTPYDGSQGVTATDSVKYHICYYNKSLGDGTADLDVDDTTGFGPETVTIREKKKGLYKYYVTDFTNCGEGNYDSMDMSVSDATVRVYTSKGLLQTFHVPTNRNGVIWEVFEIRNGVVIPSQRYYESIEDKEWWAARK